MPRLTTAPGMETNAIFAPGGETVVFSGSYDGNVDLYSVPVNGGVPVRLTFHPADDTPLSFTPDGKGILFRSSRTSPSRYETFFTMGLAPGPATELPLPMGDQASYSPDGKRLPTRLWRPHSASGSIIAAGKRPLSGLPIWMILPSRNCPATTPTTSAPCGWRPDLFPLRPQRPDVAFLL